MIRDSSSGEVAVDDSRSPGGWVDPQETDTGGAVEDLVHRIKCETEQLRHTGRPDHRDRCRRRVYPDQLVRVWVGADPTVSGRRKIPFVLDELSLLRSQSPHGGAIPSSAQCKTARILRSKSYFSVG